jgi:PAS domain S-box-containing protein
MHNLGPETLLPAAAQSNHLESDARYPGVQEVAPDAMVVVNEAGVIVQVNPQAERKFGYGRDELVAQQIGIGIDLSAHSKDGNAFPIKIMLSPLQSDDGILGTAAIRDITARNDAEHQLVQMEARYRGLLEAAPDAMVVVGEDGTIVLVNAQTEKQFGYRRDELLGEKFTRIIPQGFAERLLADAKRSAADALAQQIGTGIELWAQRKDGSAFPIEIMLSPHSNAGEVLVTAAIRNISARKQAEALLQQKIAELSRSNEELAHFADVASHDLQEPLRMVSSYTQLLARRCKGKLDADADDFIGFAVDGANRMQRLLQDLLAFSRVGSKGKEQIATSSERALQLAIRNLGGVIADSGALVTSDLLPDVRADGIQLIQLFQNLIGNAIKYQKAGVAQVRIAAIRDSGDRWIFSVTDNGPGIEQQYFDRIFGMFQRLHRREEYSGTGIGLAICKQIVERHGGTIPVESELGRGSTFRFDLAESTET